MIGSNYLKLGEAKEMRKMQPPGPQIEERRPNLIAKNHFLVLEKACIGSQAKLEQKGALWPKGSFVAKGDLYLESANSA